MKTSDKLKMYREALEKWAKDPMKSRYPEPEPRNYGLTLQLELFVAETTRRNVFVTNGVKHQNQQKEKQ